MRKSYLRSFSPTSIPFAASGLLTLARLPDVCLIQMACSGNSMAKHVSGMVKILLTLPTEELSACRGDHQQRSQDDHSRAANGPRSEERRVGEEGRSRRLGD